jgi:hypothetical protein
MDIMDSRQGKEPRGARARPGRPRPLGRRGRRLMVARCRPPWWPGVTARWRATIGVGHLVLQDRVGVRSGDPGDRSAGTAGDHDEHPVSTDGPQRRLISPTTATNPACLEPSCRRAAGAGPAWRFDAGRATRSRRMNKMSSPEGRGPGWPEHGAAVPVAGWGALMVISSLDLFAIRLRRAASLPSWAGVWGGRLRSRHGVIETPSDHGMTTMHGR